MLQWLASNWQGVLSIISMLLGVGVAISHLLHRDDIASKIQSVEDTLNQISKTKSSS